MARGQPRQPRAGVDRTEQVVALMGKASHLALSDLFAAHPEMTDMRRSPLPEQLDPFYDELMHMPYVQGLFAFGSLRQALDSLEVGYQAFRQAHAVPVADTGLAEHKRREREVRFIMRLASLLGPAFAPLDVVSSSEHRDRKDVVRAALKDAQRHLKPLLDDEFFREDLADDWRVAVLRRMLDDMSKAQGWLASETFRPVRRDHGHTAEASTTSSRQLANRLADASFRLYAYCDETILKRLLSYPWLEPLAPVTLRKLINEALERKLDQYERRVPQEDYDGSDLYGRWNVSRSIDPPWMEA